MMNILVLIKQVPASNKVEVDPVTGVLKRNGAASKMNPYDLFAIETALQLREAVGGEVSVMTMGPPQVQKIFPPTDNRERMNLTGSPDDMAKALAGKLRDLKFV